MASFQKTVYLDTLSVTNINPKGASNTLIPQYKVLTSDGNGGTVWTSTFVGDGRRVEFVTAVALSTNTNYTIESGTFTASTFAASTFIGDGSQLQNVKTMALSPDIDYDIGSGSLTLSTLNGRTVSAQEFYGDGSHLTGIANGLLSGSNYDIGGGSFAASNFYGISFSGTSANATTATSLIPSNDYQVASLIVGTSINPPVIPNLATPQPDVILSIGTGATYFNGTTFTLSDTWNYDTYGNNRLYYGINSNNANTLFGSPNGYKWNKYTGNLSENTLMDLRSTGVLYVSTMITAPSITVSSLTVSTVSGRVGLFSTLTVSSFSGIVGSFSTLAVSSLTVSTVSGRVGLLSTLTVSSLSGNNIDVSSLTVSTLSGRVGFVSDLLVSTLNVSSLTAGTQKIDSVSITNYTGVNITLSGSLITNIANINTGIISSLQVSTVSGRVGSFSTLGVSSLSVSTVFGTIGFFSTLGVSSLTVSTVSGRVGLLSTLTVSSLSGNNIDVSSLTVSTVFGRIGLFSTLAVSSLTVSTVFGTIGSFSTLAISSFSENVSITSLSVSTMAGNNASLSTLAVSSFSGNNAGISSFLVSTMAGNNGSFSTLAVSSFSGNTAGISSLLVSTVSGRAGLFSTLGVSSFTGNNAGISSFLVSTMAGNNASLSTLAVSSLTANNAGISSLLVSTMAGNNASLSTLAVSSFSGNNMSISSFLVSTMAGNNASLSSLVVSSFSGNNIGISSLSVSTIAGNNGSFSTMAVSSFTGNTISVSSLLVSTVSGRVGSFSTMAVSSFSGNNMDISSLLVSTVSGRVGSFSTMAVSSFTGNTIGVSSLIVSTIVGNNGSFSTLTVSSLFGNNIGNNTGNNIIASTLTLSTLFVSSLFGIVGSFSTLGVSSLTVSTVSGRVGLLSSLTVSSCTASNYTGSLGFFSELAVSSLNISSLMAGTQKIESVSITNYSGVNITLSGYLITSIANINTGIISSLQVSTVSGNNGLFSTLAVSLLSVSTVFGTIGSFSTLAVSTLTGNNAGISSLLVSTVSGRVGSFSTLAVSSFTVNNMDISSLLVSTVSGRVGSFSTMGVSSLTINNAVISSLLVSTMAGRVGSFSTMAVSSFSGNNMDISSLLVSTVAGNNASLSTLAVSSLTVNNAVISSLLVSTISGRVGSFSTLAVSSFSGNNAGISSLSISTMAGNNGSFTTLDVSTITAKMLTGITPTQTVWAVSTLAGGGATGIITGTNDGNGTNALFFNPIGVAIDSLYNLYVVDSDNHKIRKITPEGSVTTLAGGGVSGNALGTNNGNGTNALFTGPRGIAADSSSNLYVADYGKIRIIYPGGAVSTLAGGGASGMSVGTNNGNGTNALFTIPQGIAVDSSSNVYVADSTNNTIRIIYPGGAVSTLAGGGVSGSANGANNGNGTNALFFSPEGVAVDSSSNLYVADLGNHKIRIIYPGGAVTTLAGGGPTGSANGANNGNGTNALFLSPTGVAVDSSSNVYVADAGNTRIRIIYPGGAVSTLAGNSVGTNNGNGTNASFQALNGIAIDPNSNLYVSQISQVRKITKDIFNPNSLLLYGNIGINCNAPKYMLDVNGSMSVSSLTGNNAVISSLLVSTVSGRVGSFSTLAVSSFSGNNASISSLLVSTVSGNVSITSLSVSTMAGNNASISSLLVSSISGNSFTASIMALNILTGSISIDGSFNIINAVSTLAGGGASGINVGTNDGNGTNALFSINLNIGGVAVDSSSNIYVADAGNHKIRIIYPGGAVSTLAGGGVSGNASGRDNGNGTNALFVSPLGVAVDSSSNVYVADAGNNRIRIIYPGGAVSTLAGGGASGNPFGPNDGNGTNALFNAPNNLALDSSSNIYVADAGNHKIRIIYPGGAVSTLAGGGASGSNSGSSNGNGTNALFNNPNSVALDSTSNVYVSDRLNNTIRIIYPGGAVSTLAGGGASGTLGGFSNGNGTNALFNSPFGIAVDLIRNIYVADSTNSRIRIIYPGGAVTTLAGDGSGLIKNDNGTNASFSNPRGIALDSSSNLYVSQVGQVRKITKNLFIPNPNSLLLSGNIGINCNAPKYSLDINGSMNASTLTTYTITGNSPQYLLSFPFAGGGVSGTSSGLNDGIGTNVLFTTPFGIAVDSSSNLYVTDGNDRVRIISRGGNVTTLAYGQVGNTYRGITVDSSSNIYLYKFQGEGKIFKVTPQGAYTVYAGGNGAASSGGDGIGTNVKFSEIRSLAIDSDNIIYAADSVNSKIRIIYPGADVRSVGGGGGTIVGYSNATGTNARFNTPNGVALDSSKNIYVADTKNNVIRKISPLGEVTTLAGGGGILGTNSGFIDGNGTNALFNYPCGVAVDSSRNVYVADSSNNAIRIIYPEGTVKTLVYDNGYNRTSAFLNSPIGVVFSPDSNLYVTSYSNNSVYKIIIPRHLLLYGNVGVNCNAPQYTLDVNGFMNVSSLTGNNVSISSLSVSSISGNLRVDNGSLITLTASTIRVSGDISTESFNRLWAVSTLAGGGASGTLGGSVNGNGTNALFNTPNGVAIDSLYNVYVADTANHRIRIIYPGGTVSTFAGGGASGNSAGTNDGYGTSALFSLPEGVAVDSSNNVYVADTANQRIRKITPWGYVTTFAGSGQGADDGDNGTSAKFNFPSGLTIDSSNNMYVADTNNNKIRIIYPGGAVSTLAGGGLPANLNGNGTNARFDNPYGIAVDSRGNVYVSDSASAGNKIRIIYPGGAVSTLAGGGASGTSVGSSNGNGTNALFDRPRGVALDSTGNLYVADNSNRRIRIIYPGGAVSTLVGDGTTALLNGNGTNARFQSLKGIALDPTNNLYVSQDTVVSKITQGIFKYNYIAGSLEGISFYTGLQNTVLTTSNLSLKIISASNPDTLKVFGGINATQAIVQNSDRRIKANIETIHGALDKISSLTGVYYNRIDGLDFSSLHIGLIAQDVEQVLPEVVMTDSSEEKKKSIAYGNIVAVLIEGIKELTGRVGTLESQVVSLQSTVNAIRV